MVRDDRDNGNMQGRHVSGQVSRRTGGESYPHVRQGQTRQGQTRQDQLRQVQGMQRSQASAQRAQGQHPQQRPQQRQARNGQAHVPVRQHQQPAGQAGHVASHVAEPAKRNGAGQLIGQLGVLPAFFLGLVAVLLVVGIVLPDAEYSDTENRNLQTFPQLTLSSFVDGSFQSSFQTYVEDQFPLRDAWVTVKSLVASLSGQVENNGVYKCGDGTLILGFTEPEEDTAAEAVVEFTQAHEELNVYTLIAPTAAGINKDKLPSQVVMPDQKAYLTGINSRFAEAGATVVDLWDTFEANKDAGLYYRTDHHWTSLGASMGYSALAAALGIDTAGKTYDNLVMTTSFAGSLTAEGGYLASGTEDLSVYLRTDQDIPCVVTYVTEKEKSASPYVSSALDKRDAYQVFFGGNHPLIQIDSYAENSKGTLLVVKDSYANSLIPFLIGDYERIIVVDPRYYTGDLESLLQENTVNDVVFLYNATTFAQDTSLKRLVDAGLPQETADDGAAEASA